MNNAPNYPDSFPPLLRRATLELHQNCGVPIELVAPFVLSAASLACQGSVDIARPNCEPSPCLLYTLVVAGSGTRKSTVINKLFAPFHEIENEITDQIADNAPGYEAACLTWDLRQKSLVRQVEQEAKKHEVSKEMHDVLAAHFAARPVRQVAPKFVYEDPTPEAVVDGLCQKWHSAAVVSSEAANFLNGRAAHDLPLWNRIWDGAGVGVERIGRGAMFSRAARSSLVLAVQEKPFTDFCEKRGVEAMDLGFLARFLISRPPNVLGTRTISEKNKVEDWQGLNQFQERIKKILRDQFANHHGKSLERVILSFSDNAKRTWIDMFNEVESKIRPGESLASIPGYAAKICENIARVAAIFHFFEGKNGELIQEEDVVNAGKIIGWHADQFLKCFGKEAQLPVEQRDSEALEEWLYEVVWEVGKQYIPKNFIRQYGPNPLRNKVRLDSAIRMLWLDEKIKVRLDSSKTRLVDLNPHYFSRPRWRGNGI